MLLLVVLVVRAGAACTVLCWGLEQCSSLGALTVSAVSYAHKLQNFHRQHHLLIPEGEHLVRVLHRFPVAYAPDHGAVRQEQLDC